MSTFLHLNLKSYFLTVILIQISSYSFCQEKTDSVLEVLKAKYPQERIYLEKNKQEYISGETILLKGFVFSGYQTSDISTNLYVELLDKNKITLAKNVSPVYQGISSMVIQIPADLSTGIYYIRAYTVWMLNFDERFQYLQPVTIYNPHTHTSLIKDSSKWSFAIIPEGGKLLDSIPAKIAVRFYDLHQNYKMIRGTLWDRTQNIKIATFTPLDQNVGICRFIPFSGHKYEVEAIDALGNSKTQPLPEVYTAGAVLNTIQTDSSVVYKVLFKNIGPDKIFKLVGVLDNNIVYKATMKSASGIVTRSIAKKNLERGVLYFTLFDESLSVVSERLCFLYPDQPPKPNLIVKKQDFSPRAINEIEVQVDSSAFLFLSVADNNEENSLESDIKSSFWLTGDFLNPITKVSDYFQTGHFVKNQELDVLMISEKWQRFNWQKLLSGSFPEIKYHPDNFLSYEVFVTRKGVPLANERLTLMAFYPDSTNQIFQINTDNVGKFLLSGLLFEGKATINYYIPNKKSENDSLKMRINPVTSESRYLQSFPETKIIETKMNETLLKQVQNSVNDIANQSRIKNAVKELEEVTVKTKAKTPTDKLNEELSSGRFYNPREKVFDLVNNPSNFPAMSVLNWTLGRVPGDPQKFTYFLDESPIDKEYLNIPMSDIAMIKVHGTGASHQIFIYQRKGGEQAASMGNNKNNIIVSGYIGVDSTLFKYSDLQNISLPAKDTRQTIFWSDFLYLENGGVKNIKFINNDHSLKVKVSIIGVYSNGEPLHFEKTLGN